MSEIPGLYEGVEAVKVVVEGTEVFLRLGGDVLNWTLDKMVMLAKLLARNIRSWEEELKEGEVHFKDLLDKDNGRIEMLQIEHERFLLLIRSYLPEEKKKKLDEIIRKYGNPKSVETLPD